MSSIHSDRFFTKSLGTLEKLQCELARTYYLGPQQKLSPDSSVQAASLVIL